MTIPMSIPFGRRRLVVSMSLLAAQPTSSKSKLVEPGTATQFPEAVDATDQELAKLNQRAAAEADRRRWQAQAIFHGVRA